MPTLEQVLGRLAREGELYERLPEQRVRCYACGHRCVILPGQRGICKVRWNEDGRLLVPTGYVAGLQLDPVEKKPFFHAYPGSRALSFGMLGCDFHCQYCFSGETPVVTPTGAVPISVLFERAPDGYVTSDGEVRFAEATEVISASGQARRVSKAFRHHYRGSLVVVKPMYFPAIRCTPEHRWLATTAAAQGHISEIAARDLTPQHLLVVPRPITTAGPTTLDLADVLREATTTFAVPRSLSPDEVEAIMRATEQGESSRVIGARLGRDPSYIRHVRSKFRRGRWVYERTGGILVDEHSIRFPQEHRPGIPRFIPLDKAFARLLGYYCAEGSVIRSRRRPNSFGLAFTFGHSEEAARQEVKESLEQIFGVRAREVRRATTTAIAVGKASLALALAALCGKGAKRKHVPAEIFRADPSIQEAFLDAYVAGDGHTYPSGKICATTISSGLAYGVAWLSLALGRLPAVYRLTVGSEGRIQGRLVRRHPEQFTVFWYREPKATARFRDAGEYFLIPVKSVTTVPFEGDVFNLEIEQEHSYLAGFCAVKNCQNYVTSQALRDPLAGVPPETVTPADIVEAAVRHRARILTSTYNEPLITSEWAVEIFRAAKASGLVCSFVSNGNATAEVLEYLRPWVDLYKVDLKGLDDRRYRKLGGVLQNVLETIQRLHVQGFWLEVVTLVVPGFNDSDAELRDLAQFLASVSPDIPWHVTAFHADYKMLDRADTSADTLLRAAQLGLDAGLRYVYAGNLPGRVGPFENTWCPTCRALLIARTGFTIHQDRLTPRGGVCPDCETQIPGRWR